MTAWANQFLVFGESAKRFFQNNIGSFLKKRCVMLLAVLLAIINTGCQHMHMAKSDLRLIGDQQAPWGLTFDFEMNDGSGRRLYLIGSDNEATKLIELTDKNNALLALVLYQNQTNSEAVSTEKAVLIKFTALDQKKPDPSIARMLNADFLMKLPDISAEKLANWKESFAKPVNLVNSNPGKLAITVPSGPPIIVSPPQATVEALISWHNALCLPIPPTADSVIRCVLEKLCAVGDCIDRHGFCVGLIDEIGNCAGLSSNP